MVIGRHLIKLLPLVEAELQRLAYRYVNRERKDHSTYYSRES